MKTFYSAIVILGIVSAGLAFVAKPISAGNVYCVPTTITPLQIVPCKMQIPTFAVTYNAVSSGGSTFSPCLYSDPVTYIDNGSTCNVALPGTEYILTDDE